MNPYNFMWSENFLYIIISAVKFCEKLQYQLKIKYKFSIFVDKGGPQLWKMLCKSFDLNIEMRLSIFRRMHVIHNINSDELVAERR